MVSELSRLSARRGEQATGYGSRNAGAGGGSDSSWDDDEDESGDSGSEGSSDGSREPRHGRSGQHVHESGPGSPSKSDSRLSKLRRRLSFRRSDSVARTDSNISSETHSRAIRTRSVGSADGWSSTRFGRDRGVSDGSGGLTRSASASAVSSHAAIAAAVSVPAGGASSSPSRLRRLGASIKRKMSLPA